jgi:serine/threonine-protein kinase
MQPRQASQVLDGKYRLVRPLGKGGMGTVWHAEHLTLSSPVALKLLESGVPRESDTLQRFLREARTAAALRSPHVVQILDYGVDGETPYIAMELLEGESLAQRLSRLGTLSLGETARIVQHIGRAMARAHDAGVIHRDLKPENVFIVENDDEEVIKVLDFGIAKTTAAATTASAAGATRTGALLGTPFYMSPEQCEAVKDLDHRTDIWSLGVIAYKCLLGRSAFTGDSLGQVILSICSHPLPVPSRAGPVPEGFDAWFARACARNPRERFESAKLAASEFVRLCDAPASVSGTVSIPPGLHGSEPQLAATTGQATNSELSNRARGEANRGRLALLAVLALVLLALVSFALQSRPKQEAPWPSSERSSTAAAPIAAPREEVAPHKEAEARAEVAPLEAPAAPNPAASEAPSASGALPSPAATPEAASAPVPSPPEAREQNAVTPAPSIKRVPQSKPAKSTGDSKPKQPIDLGF